MADIFGAAGLALVSGLLSGLVAWGGLRVELKWLRADLERIEARQMHIEGILYGGR